MKTQFYAPCKVDGTTFLHKDTRAAKWFPPQWTTNPEEAKRYHDRRQAVHFARTNKFGLKWFVIIEVTTEVANVPCFPIE